MDIFAVTTQEVLDKISRHCPDALSAYLQCMNRVDDEGTVFFSKHLVTVDMSEDWHPIDNGISVTLADVNGNE